MPPKLKAILLLAANVVIGLLLLVATQALPVKGNAGTIIVFAAFVLLNLVYARIFKLGKELRTFWSLRKMGWLLPGVAAGALLVLFPAMCAQLAGKTPGPALLFKQVTIISLLFTFLIIGWEELWFRGLILNYCSKALRPVAIALIMGALFMLVHAPNPSISLLKEGPSLFFAGALLTSLYFLYGNIWLPAGVHFGNNFFGGFISATLQHNAVYGDGGYLYTTLLGAATIFFLYKLARKQTKRFA